MLGPTIFVVHHKDTGTAHTATCAEVRATNLIPLQGVIGAIRAPLHFRAGHAVVYGSMWSSLQFLIFPNVQNRPSWHIQTNLSNYSS